MTVLNKKDIKTILASDYVSIRYDRDKDISRIECTKEDGTHFGLRHYINVEIKVNGIFNKAYYGHTIYRDSMYNNIVYFFKTLKKDNDVSIIFNRGAMSTNVHKENNLVTDSLLFKNKESYCVIKTEVGYDNSASMLQI